MPPLPHRQPTLHELPMNSPEFKIIAWNACGIRNKISDIKILITERNPDLILIQETHLNPNVHLQVSGFYCHRTDRPLTENSGGTLILIKRHIPHTPLPPYTRPGLECTRLLLHSASPIIISSVYLQPKQKLTLQDLSHINQNYPFFCAGDFNSKNKLWGCNTTNPGGTALMKILSKEPIVIASPNSPTTSPLHRSHRPDILDIGLHSDSLPAPTCYTLPRQSSDHLPVLYDISLSLPTPKPPIKICWDTFRLYINAKLSPNPPPPSTIADISTNIRLLTEFVQDATTASSQTSAATRKPPALPPLISDLRTRKNHALHIFQRTGYRQYKTLANKLQKQITSEWHRISASRWEQFTSTLDTNKTYNAFKIAKALKSPHQPPNPIKMNGSLITNPQDIVNTIADHLTTKYQKPPASTIDDSLISGAHNQVRLTPSSEIPPVTLDELNDLIKLLPSKKSPGLDQINNTHIRHFTPPVRLFLLNIYNSCLTLKHFPDEWKISKVITLPKPNKDATNPENLRPIHLLSSLSKLLERIILKRLQSSLPTEATRNEQAGFIQGRSTTDQTVRVVDLIQSAKTKGLDTIGIFLDIKSAFDTVWHQGILIKLANLRVNPNILHIINSFLANRQFSVHSRHHFSPMKPIEAGVPQGAVLSPTLYNIYTYDIPPPPPYCSNIHLAIYADDVAILSHTYPKTTQAASLNTYLNQISKYFLKWKLTIHPQKTIAIKFSKKKFPTNPPLKINSTPITYQNTAKYLGLLLDPKLNFKRHITATKSKTTAALNSISPLLRSKSFPLRCRIHLITACILPIITYSSPAWSYIGDPTIRPLSQLYSRALKKAIHAPWYVNYNIIHQDLQKPKLKEIIQNLNVNYFHRITSHPNPLIAASSKPQPKSAKIKRPISSIQ